MKTIIISLTLPDDVIVQVASGPAIPPMDFEHEPLPTDTFASEQEFAGGAPATPPPAPVPPPANGGVTPFRGAAMAQPMPVGNPVWQTGNVHQQGHKPLKAGRNGGLFCPTKVGEDPSGKGIWCEFRIS